jgi:hypothetical protein
LDDVGREQAAEGGGEEGEDAEYLARAVPGDEERRAHAVHAEAGDAPARPDRRGTYSPLDAESLNQDELCDYLLSVHLERGSIESREETEQMKKVINAIIKKLIREERMLMIVEDSNDLSKRILQLHPNYVFE